MTYCKKCGSTERYRTNCRPCKKINKREWRQKQSKSNRKRVDPLIKRLKSNLRRRLRFALHSNQKRGSAIQDLGCTIIELKSYLENQFLSGMSWDNYGLWEIDHIIPLSRVDLTDIYQLKKVCHYSNLQPLWRVDNRDKSNKLHIDD